MDSVVSRLFERLILLNWEHLLETSQLQFGFRKVGCTECSHVAQESIDHYLL